MRMRTEKEVLDINDPLEAPKIKFQKEIGKYPERQHCRFIFWKAGIDRDWCRVSIFRYFSLKKGQDFLLQIFLFRIKKMLVSFTDVSDEAGYPSCAAIENWG